MDGLTEALQKLIEDEPELEVILNTFEEIDRVYQAGLKAMDTTEVNTSQVGNSAEVTISFRNELSATGLLFLSE